MEALVLQQPPTVAAVGALMGLLILAVTSDLCARRIPNELVLSGLALACWAQCQAFGWQAGALRWLAGAGVGLLLLLPGYALLGLGGGDVKLMAMVGAFFDGIGALQVGLAAMLAGGVMALMLLALRQVARFVWLPDRYAHSFRSSRRLPYGVAIAIGCGAVLWPSF